MLLMAGFVFEKKEKEQSQIGSGKARIKRANITPFSSFNPVGPLNLLAALGFTLELPEWVYPFIVSYSKDWDTIPTIEPSCRRKRVDHLKGCA